jgi:hypothetical protein
MNKNYYMIFAVTLAGLALPGSASALDLAFGGHGGTMGTGVEGTLGLNSHMNLRLGVNSGEYEIMKIEDKEGLKYDNPSIDFDNQYLMLDFYPFSHGKLHLTAGYFKNSNQITASARVDDNNTEFGGKTADINTQVNALVTFKDGAYAGIGFGNAADGGFIHFGLDIGVVMQGSPQANLEVIDPPSGVDISQDDIDAEEQNFEEENKDFDMWPVINLSLSVQLF